MRITNFPFHTDLFFFQETFTVSRTSLTLPSTSFSRKAETRTLRLLRVRVMRDTTVYEKARYEKRDEILNFVWL